MKQEAIEILVVCLLLTLIVAVYAVTKLVDPPHLMQCVPTTIGAPR